MLTLSKWELTSPMSDGRLFEMSGYATELDPILRGTVLAMARGLRAEGREVTVLFHHNSTEEVDLDAEQ